MGEISILRQSQSVYEDNMKKAFMRGVCALNMEAMTMFHDTTPPCPSSSYPPPAPPTSLLSHETDQRCQPQAPPQTVSRHVNVDFNKRKHKKMHPSISVEKHVH